ncbi:SAF domain-containing protein [Ornithinimicrobium sp. F0845]|uniref:SAF domain-containing protein n=1 Tax=Ornithinimicrobium sp. F0845 TaxID=2926412 RepID=UPI001FF283FB|nr:SAF domain-containing protein [Ornithinimicrobium sp. F0845]MCK0111388.1 SAF domain-containing protein [Ornithinimicrobium sp. F0845]
MDKMFAARRDRYRGAAAARSDRRSMATADRQPPEGDIISSTITREERTTAPRARRLRAPGWRDTRLLVGLLLVMLSVAGGVRLASSLDETTPVYAAAREILPGQEVEAQDLVPVRVRMDAPMAHYLDGTQPLAPGTVALRQVAEGELVPAGSLGTASQARDKTVTVPIDPAAAQTFTVGTVVDMWVSRRDPDQVGTAYLDPELLLSRAVVAATPTSSNGLGMGIGRAAVQVVVPADRVGAVISSVDQGAKLTLVPSPGGAGSTS